MIDPDEYCPTCGTFFEGLTCLNCMDIFEDTADDKNREIDENGDFENAD